MMRIRARVPGRFFDEDWVAGQEREISDEAQAAVMLRAVTQSGRSVEQIFAVAADEPVVEEAPARPPAEEALPPGVVLEDEQETPPVDAASAGGAATELEPDGAEGGAEPPADDAVEPARE